MTEQRHSALGLHPIEFKPNEDHGELLKRRQIVRRTQLAALIVLVLLAVGAGRTLLSRIANARALDASTTEQARQYVKTTQARRNAAGQTLSLPGTLQGFVQSPIAARAGGGQPGAGAEYAGALGGTAQKRRGVAAGSR